MKLPFLTFILLLLSLITPAQSILSGEYDSGLMLAYDSSAKLLTGFYENYTGYDEQTQSPQFSCIFYLEGRMNGNRFAVNTYYPNDSSDFIQGDCQVLNDTTVLLKLQEDHGGCWNVQHFADEEVKFHLERPKPWTQIRFVAVDKAYFYPDQSGSKRGETYVIKDDVVSVEKIEKDRALCTFYGKKVTSGWIQTSDLNTVLGVKQK